MPDARTKGSVSFVPVRTNADIDLQWDRELRCPRHELTYAGRELVDEIRANLEYELVVYLHDQACVELRIDEPAIDVDHRALDDVGGRALHRRVDRRALRALSKRSVARLNVV